MYVPKIRHGLVKKLASDGRMKIQMAVEMKCCRKNKDICRKCGKPPIGDYWHLKNKSFLCRICMLKERRRLSHKFRSQLDQYQVNLKKIKYF